MFSRIARVFDESDTRLNNHSPTLKYFEIVSSVMYNKIIFYVMEDRNMSVVSAVFK